MVIGDAPLEDIRGNRRLDPPIPVGLLCNHVKQHLRNAAGVTFLPVALSFAPLPTCAACERWIRGNLKSLIPLERNYGITCSCDPSVICQTPLLPVPRARPRNGESGVSVRYIYYGRAA